MKPLSIMTNAERAKLLTALFPEELQGMLLGMQQACDYLNSNEDNLRDGWDNGFASFDLWQATAARVATILARHGDTLTKSSNLFAEQLFDGHTALFTIDCLIRQAAQNENPKYRQAVALLFD